MRKTPVGQEIGSWPKRKTRSLLESLPDAIVVVKKDGKIVFVNSQAQGLFGYTDQELQGRAVETLFPERLRSKHPEYSAGYFSNLQTKPEGTSLELYGQRKDGGEIPVEICLSPVETEEGVVVISAVRDISERKHTENKLNQYADIVKSMQIGLYVYQLEDINDDRTFRIIAANPAATKLTGLAAEEVLYKTLDEKFPRLREKGIPQLLAEVVRSGETREVEDIYYADKRLVEAVWSFKAFPLPDRCVGVVFENFTERKRVEKLLEQHRRELVLCVTSEGTILYSSAAGLRLLRGWGCEKGQPIPDKWKLFIAGIYDSKKSKEIEVKSGDQVFSVLLVPCIDDQYVNFYRRNVTEQKKLENQVIQSQKMDAVGTLAGGIAHDFNNLLTVIKGYAGLLLERLPPDSPLREHVEEPHQAGVHGEALAQKLLTFSRKEPLEITVFNLNDPIESTVKMLPRLIREDIELKFLLAPDLGHVQGDPRQIEQVLLNLAVNGQDAMPEGGTLTIGTANVTFDEEYTNAHLAVEPGSYIQLTVTDTGEGMDDATCKRIFEPFFTTKEVGKGTGLGLFAVHGIVKQHGGHVWVYSEPGLGTTFKIYLSRADAPEKHVVVEAQAGSVDIGTILIAEDEEGVRNLIRSILEAKGYEVLCARTVDQAEQVFTQNASQIALLVTDVVMPGGHGPELHRRLQAKHPRLKVLYISGYSDQSILQTIAVPPHMPLLQKPFSPKALEKKVRELLES